MIDEAKVLVRLTIVNRVVRSGRIVFISYFTGELQWMP